MDGLKKVFPVILSAFLLNFAMASQAGIKRTLGNACVFAGKLGVVASAVWVGSKIKQQVVSCKQNYKEHVAEEVKQVWRCARGFFPTSVDPKYEIDETLEQSAQDGLYKVVETVAAYKESELAQKSELREFKIVKAAIEKGRIKKVLNANKRRRLEKVQEEVKEKQQELEQPKMLSAQEKKQVQKFQTQLSEKKQQIAAVQKNIENLKNRHELQIQELEQKQQERLQQKLDKTREMFERSKRLDEKLEKTEQQEVRKFERELATLQKKQGHELSQLQKEPVKLQKELERLDAQAKKLVDKIKKKQEKQTEKDEKVLAKLKKKKENVEANAQKIADTPKTNLEKKQQEIFQANKRTECWKKIEKATVLPVGAVVNACLIRGSGDAQSGVLSVVAKTGVSMASIAVGDKVETFFRRREKAVRIEDGCNWGKDYVLRCVELYSDVDSLPAKVVRAIEALNEREIKDAASVRKTEEFKIVEKAILDGTIATNSWTKKTDGIKRTPAERRAFLMDKKKRWERSFQKKAAYGFLGRAAGLVGYIPLVYFIGKSISW